jgi:hypothetical protein
VLHRAEHRLELGVAQARSSASTSSHWSVAIYTPTAHVDKTDHADTCVGLEAVGGKAVVDSVQQAKVA